MSWLSLPLPNPFKSLQLDQQNQKETPPPSPPSPPPPLHSDDIIGSGKDDLSVFGQTVGRQLRGVAAFLAPSPSSDTANTSNSSQSLLGIRNDLVEIGGSLKSLLSNNKAVSEISRFASNFWQFEEEEDEYGRGDHGGSGSGGGVAGVNDEVLDFIKEVLKQPECWTDFPLELDSDFNISYPQREHALAVERLIPSFADVRFNVCSCMSDKQFWKRYFVFLLPRLSEQDFKILITPEIVEARHVLLENLRNRNSQLENSDASQKEDTEVNETQGESSSQEKVLPQAKKAANDQIQIEQDDTSGVSSKVQKQLETGEDISFSDLEEYDNDLSVRSLQNIDKISSPRSSNEWVRLNASVVDTRGGLQKADQSFSRKRDSEGEDSNDWLTIDDFDSES